MKRLLIVLAVLLVGLAASAHYKIRSSVTDGLETIKANLSPFATVSFGDVSTTLEGNIEIDNVRITPRATGESVAIEQVAVITGGPWALLNLKSRLDSGELPQHLAFSVKGLDAEFIYEYMDLTTQANPFEVFESAGCGNRDRLNRQDLASMGYGNMVLDLEFGYQLSSTGNEITFTSTTTTRDHSHFTVDLELSNSNSFATIGPSPLIFKQSRLESAAISLTDLGHLERTKSFCADEIDIGMEAFKDRHLQAWHAAWHQFDLNPGENLLEAYGDYYAHSGSTLTLEIEPYPALDLSDNYVSSNPEYLSERLNPRIGTERTGLKDVRVTISNADNAPPAPAPIADETEIEQRPTTTPKSAPVTNAGGKKSIAVSELSNHLGEDVSILLKDGQASKGRIQAVEDGKLKLKLRMYGGSMVIPIPLNSISSVQRT